MDGQKVAIVALVALAMFFVVTRGLAGSHGGGRSDRPDPVEFLKGLQSQRFLDLDDHASTTCGRAGNALEVPAGAACELTLAERGRFGTPTRVVFQPSQSIRVRVDPERGASQDVTVDPDECFQSAVDTAGGRMTFGPAPFAVALALTDDPGDDCPEDAG
jgi:hypothetical protein